MADFGGRPIGLGAAIGFLSKGIESAVVVDVVPARDAARAADVQACASSRS